MERPASASDQNEHVRNSLFRQKEGPRHPHMFSQGRRWVGPTFDNVLDVTRIDSEQVSGPTQPKSGGNAVEHVSSLGDSWGTLSDEVMQVVLRAWRQLPPRERPHVST